MTAAPDAETTRPASPPTHAVTVAWDVRVPTRDGTELSANIWHPVATHDDPDRRFPAILEMIPYGKDNWRRNADVGRGEWFAARGYAFVRVDVRGTGSSAGVALDEYTEVETRDGYDAVEWLAAQPWCTGAIGMWGISYGAFTAIQVAKLRPPHLLAIVPVQGTDDRYLTDVHYIGGCVTASELSQYGVSQVAMNAMPPDVGLRGDGWLDEWRSRLELTPPWLITWLRNQTDGPYWRPGSLAPEYDAIEAAIFNVGGWCDAYVDSAFRMQAKCTAPSWTLVGNWVHGWPQDSIPGPNLDELHEVARNGLDDEPAVVWFERDYSDPEPFPVAWPGRWRATSAFPHPAVAAREWRFGGGGLPQVGRLVDDADDTSAGLDTFAHRPTVGTRASLSWGAGGIPNGLARDLRPDEAHGLTYTSDPLADSISILGEPEVILHLAVSAPVATAVVRLTDVAPDGTSSQVTAGILNLTHRRSDERPEPMEPGRVEEIRVPLRHVGYRFESGHRVRVSVASSAWPVVWPSPFPATFDVHRGPAKPSRLVLPEIPAADGPGDLPVPAYKKTSPDVRAVGGEGASDTPAWRIEEDVIEGTVTVTIHDGGQDVLEDGRGLYAAETLRLTASDKDPASARLEADVVYRWHEISHEIEIRARSLQTSDADAFDLSVALEVDLDGERLFERSWLERIPRHLV
jgi:putative CocE/NonD family hydrolase